MNDCIDCQNEIDNYTKEELCEKLNRATTFPKHRTYEDFQNVGVILKNRQKDKNN